MTSEDRQALAQRRREKYNSQSTEEQQHSTSHEVPSLDDPVIVNKITEFYNELATLEMKKCSICLEQFPNLKIDSTGSCNRCSTDKHIPKVYSPLNNMHPGPVPSELSVSIAVDYIHGYYNL